VEVAILGGTGPFGRAVAARLAAEGVEVVIGSRDAGRAAATAAEVGGRGARNEAAVGAADLVVLAVNADAAVQTALAVRNFLSSPVLSVASELRFIRRSARPGAVQASLAERTAEVVEVPVVAGLHSLAAGKLAGGKPDEDALLCGDDDDAKAVALDLAAQLVAGRALDLGPLAVARALEGMTAAIVNVNKRYKAHAGIRLTGLP
jgi:8-hydroxy-5-deazaflavin:NADPH oxidoreductase